MRWEAIVDPPRVFFRDYLLALSPFEVHLSIERLKLILFPGQATSST